MAGQINTRFRAFGRKLLAVLLVAGTAAGITTLPALDRFSLVDADILLLLREIVAPVHSDPADSPVVVVGITPESFTAPGLDGLPVILWTDQMAAVQRKVLDAGATVYAWDVILQNSAGKSLAGILSGRVDLDTDSARSLQRLDRDLLVGMRTFGRQQHRVVLGFTDLGQEPVRPHDGLVRQVGGADNLRPVNAYTDPDGILRGVGLVYPTVDGGSVPSLALEVAARHTGADFQLTAADRFQFAGRDIPVYSTGLGDTNLLVNFDTTDGAIPSYRFHDILNCADPAYLQQAFSGKAVLFGFVTDLDDRKLMSNRLVRTADFSNAPATCQSDSPVTDAVSRRTEAGVYLHAHAVRNLLDGTPIARPQANLQLLAALILAGLTCTIAMRYRPVTALVATLAMLAAYGVLCAIVFRDGTVLPLIDPVLASGLGLAGSIGLRFVTADRDRQVVRQTFSHYLDRKVIDAMLESGDVPALGGENRDLTCFFSDIEAFSAISEKMGPPELVAFLNEYFQIIGVEIEAKGGIIERFLGDAICAVFGAPVRDDNHAVNAVRCALAIDRGLAAAQDKFDVPAGRIVRTRIGINTGLMTAGNVGAQRRKTYTVMGDAVNLAARLESVNKQYGTLVMAGEDTVTATGDAFEWRLLDRVRVVGRESPVGLYEPLGEKGTVAADILQRRDAYQQALALFQQQDFAAAQRIFESLAESGDGAAGKAVSRCQDRRNNPPPADWDGVTDLTKK